MRGSALSAPARVAAGRPPRTHARGVGNPWHVAEFAIAVGAGIAAGSIALVAFGADS